MIAYDIFTNDAFQATEVTEAAGLIAYIPQDLNNLGIFEVEPIQTTTVSIYRRDETLAVVPTTPRGAQETMPERDSRRMRQLPTIRLAQKDRINAHELQNIIVDGRPFDANLDNAMAEVERRQRKLMRKLELTREYHRLAALQGKLLDADGSVILDYFAEFGFSQPAAIPFDFGGLISGQLRMYIKTMVKAPMATMLRNSGRGGAGVRIGALCGSNFFNQLNTSPEVRETYLNTQAAQALREEIPLWDSFNFAGVQWMEFSGSNISGLTIGDDEVKFFPIGAEDVFKEYRAPGEDIGMVNEPGREFYAMVSPDYRPNRMAWVDAFLYAYPLFACISPELLLRGVVA